MGDSSGVVKHWDPITGKEVDPHQVINDIRQVEAGGPTMAEWWEEYKDEIEQARLFGVAPLPEEPGTMHQDLSRSNAEQSRMASLLTDAESFVIMAYAAAVLRVRREYPDITADERRAVAKADPQHLGALDLRGDLAAVVDSLKNKSYALMNLRRTTYTPQLSQE